MPTVFADVTPDMRVYREANDTDYGLTNYVQTTDNDKARRVARRLRSGMVEMNGLSRGAGAPFGGKHQSGKAAKVASGAIEEFREAKSVSGWNEVPADA